MSDTRPDARRPRVANAPIRAMRALHHEIVECRRCPRLVEWREQVARDKRRAFSDWTYWGRPLVGFGDPEARVVIVGLAPAAHGANRTGRMFTGDRSGDFLFAALHRAGLASQPTSVSRDDGLELRDVYIVAPVRCAPPDNMPTPRELATCSGFLDQEVALLAEARVFVPLGAIAWRATWELLARAGCPIPTQRPTFGHGVVARVPGAPPPRGSSPARELVARERGAWVVGSYHVSQQNTQTGKLTPAMFDEVLRLALDRAGGGGSVRRAEDTEASDDVSSADAGRG